MKDLNYTGGRIFLENVDHAMAAMWVYPHDTVGIGPISELRANLARKQSNSLKSKAGPYLVRFEIVDCWGPGPQLPDPDRPDSASYRLKAILYWGYVKPNSSPARSVRILRTGELTGVHAGASLGMVVLETREYRATPNDIKQTEMGFELGSTGWTIDEESKRVTTQTRMIGAHNNAVAFYDISMTAFKE
jgi:hypothetical protein